MMVRLTFFEMLRVSTKESREERRGERQIGDWSLESERDDLSESMSERRDRRSSTARMKSW